MTSTPLGHFLVIWKPRAILVMSQTIYEYTTIFYFLAWIPFYTWDTNENESENYKDVVEHLIGFWSLCKPNKSKLLLFIIPSNSLQKKGNVFVYTSIFLYNSSWSLSWREGNNNLIAIYQIQCTYSIRHIVLVEDLMLIWDVRRTRDF